MDFGYDSMAPDRQVRQGISHDVDDIHLQIERKLIDGFPRTKSSSMQAMISN
jgi:hypothetical protein